MSKRKDLSYNDIPNLQEDWMLDPRNGYKYSGESVQKFIKEMINSKMGYFYYDTASNRYLCFADEDSKNQYVENPTLTELVLGSFDAPFNYEASITLLTPSYNAVFLGSTGNYLDFTFDIKNKSGNSTGENVNVTYTFIRNATKKVVTETRRYGEAVRFNIDEYLLEGANTVIVGIQGQTSLAATTASLTYQVVNLSFSDELDISKIYDLTSGSKTVEVFFNVSGYGTKIVEWFLDGEQLPFVKTDDEVIDVASSRIKYIELENLTSGVHTIQTRAYTLVNGEKFYTDTLYREIIVTNGASAENFIAIATSLPYSHGLVSEQNPLIVYGAEQYIPYSIRFATRKSGELTISLGSEELATLLMQSGSETTYQIVSNKSGTLNLSFKGNGIERSVDISINKTTLNIEEINTSLVFDFSARGKNNSAIDKDVWSYNGFTGSFNGFNWNASSGWVDNALLLNSGASFSVDISPLATDATALGKTLEFEFYTKNVEDDNAVVCDLTTNGVGVLITASEARITSVAGEAVSTKFKSGEVNRIAFVVNRNSGVTYKGLVFIYVNGILSGAVNYGSADKFTSESSLMFQGTDDAQVAIRSMRFYDTALTADNILNNYILYRDNLNEMMEVYYRNDIYEKGSSTFSTDALLHYLPVMIITGDIPTLEAATSTSAQILVDIDYTNEQDPTKNFKMKNAALRIQGTSSLAYPRKNFRFYTQKEESTLVYDANNNLISDKLYSFIDGAQPVDCWCLKADFAESSGTHNTGIARIWNKVMYGAIIQHKNVLDEEVNGYALRTKAQTEALQAGYSYDVRTTIDGFPIVLFYKKNTNDTDLIFLGKYNFNNDKSTPSVFGFENIPNFDNSRMQCWETKDNGHPLGLFTDISNFDTDWSEAFESRYPDTKTPNTADLKAFSEWINGVSQEDFILEKWAHMDVYKVAAYYVYLMRFGAVDQPVKNGFLTSEDGEHFYYINYDNDTINGLINTGHLRLDPTINRQTIGTDGEYVYAGHDSVLWNRCEADSEFMDIVSIVDNALYSAGLRYDEVMKVFNDEQSDKWAERVYNQDAEYKYLLPYVNQATNNLFMLQGSRSSHRAWWLSKRFSLYDSLFVSGAYRDKNISFKCLNDTEAGQRFTITAGIDMNYGYGLNNGIRETGIALNTGDEYTFTTTDKLNLGDVVKVFAAPNLIGLDLSEMASRVAVLDCSAASDSVLGSKMKKLTLGGKGFVNTELTAISGINKLEALQEINVEGYQGITSLDLTTQKDLRKVYAHGSGVASVDFSAGAPVDYLELPSAMLALELEQLPYLRSENIKLEGISNIWKMSVNNCPYVSSDFDFVYNWILSKTTADAYCYLSMDNIDWKNISGEQMERIASIGTVSLSGRAKLNDITAEQGELFMRVFGEDVFTEGADFYISAPVSVTIYGEDSILEGDSATYTSKVFPMTEGVTAYTLVQSRDGVTFDAETGVLTTTENGLATSSIVIKAVFTPADGEEPSESTKTISIVKRTYPSGITIEGNGDLKVNTRFDWASTTPSSDVNGVYNVEWIISGGLASYYSAQSYDGYCVLHQDQTPPTTVSGTLVVNLRKAVDNSIVATASQSISFAYVYPSSVVINGKNTIIGGASEVYTAIITPSNYDIGVTYTWSVSGSSNVSIESSNGSVCTLGTNVPETEESFTLTCVVKSVDNKVSITKTFDATLQSRPNFITATYNVTSTSSTTSLLYRSYTLSNVTYMEIDGEEVSPVLSHTFTTTGLHTVKLTVSSLESAFYSVTGLESIDFSECNGLIYTKLTSMFNGCSSLKTIIWGDCNFSKVTNATSLFRGCTALTSITTPPFAGAKITDINSFFIGCSNVKSIDLTGLKGSPIADTNSAFKNCWSLTSIDLTPLAGAPIKSLTQTFSGCSQLKSIDLTPLAGAPIKSLDLVFSGCSSLTSIDLTGLTGAPITSIVSAFYECSRLTSIDLTPLTGAPITTLNQTFSGCSSLTSVDLTGLAGAPITNMSSTFNGCSKLTSIDLTPLTGAPITTMSSTFDACSGLTSIDLTPLAGAPITDMSSTFSYCTKLTSIDLTPFNGAPIKKFNSAFFECLFHTITLPRIASGTNVSFIGTFTSCTNLTSIDFTPFAEANVEFGYNVFGSCSNVTTLIMPWVNAPSVLSDTFGIQTGPVNNKGYVGRNSYNLGINKLIIPINSTGYNEGAWADPLQNTDKCGFEIDYPISQIECTSLVIVANDVIGNATNTTISWTAIINGVDTFTGESVVGIEVTGTATSEEFPQNTSETETVEREISFTYMGVTATTTIVQGVWINALYSAVLNDQWELSTSVANPDTALYDGVYQSFSNKGVSSTAAKMYIDFVRYESFRLYIRSYAEGNFDYVMVSQIDMDITNSSSYSDSTLVKAHTRGKQNSGTSISDYTLVEFTGLDYGAHRITIVYRKDESGNNSDDRGYVLIPKNQ